ncbi:tetratricopeptide repeat protein [Streptomyces sp. NPDC088354]|uniref:tetratricopeptide repeat protein n=1 Tax=unclassified Streptomyces TaxID=2593676 RepID=UPI0029B61400|nr:tetratricopeptide repeat protein [Streptomyces sp. MI02-7b]MDX3075046.1 tetratricopeptide repeat protein [Streptomyces sp. MI02-7b]
MDAPPLGRLRTAVLLIALSLGLALALTAGALVLGGSSGRTGPAGGPAAVAARAGDAPLDRLAAGDLAGGIAGLQDHLRAQPKDSSGWATLGAAYVEQARTSGDPTRYPQAAAALARSLRITPDGNDAALAGQAALAAARHDFGTALSAADRALRTNPYNERALAVRVDALVELGRYDAARTAAEHADALRPGVPVFTRLAYVHELRGDAAGARRILTGALDSASTPGDTAYVATALGQLAWSQGRYADALGQYATALRASPGYLPAIEGRGRAYAARGDRARAVRDLADVVRRYPLPAQLAELGELYEAAGRRDKAREQYAVVGTWIALAKANGVATDLDAALVAADHGDPREALRAARAEWARRHTVHTADALAWALHANGRDREALPYAVRSSAPGYRNAAFLYHRGVIEAALGRRPAARASLAAALRLNPGFSPTGAPAARAALARIARIEGDPS